jgi:hypothetical protein
VSDPWNPHLVGNVDTPWSAHGVAIAGDHVYVADSAGLQVVDVSVPTQPYIVSSLGTAAAGVACQGNYVYLTCDLRVQVVDVTDPFQPEVVGEVFTPTPGAGLAVAGSHLYVGTAGWSFVPSELQVVDVRDPFHPRLVGSVGRASVVAIGDAYVCSADSRSGFQITSLQCEPATAVSEGAVPSGTRLQVYPNPGPGRVTIRLESPLPGPVSGTVYDVTGRRVRTLSDLLPGRAAGELHWDGQDDLGRPAPAGLYFARVRHGGRSEVVRVTLVR